MSRTRLILAALDASRSQVAHSASYALTKHGAFMHHVIAWLAVMLAAVLLVGCSEPIGLSDSGAEDTASIVEIARRKPQWPLPDSIRIPSMPIPPILEELPPIEDSP
jgi:hypothetical protein